MIIGKDKFDVIIGLGVLSASWKNKRGKDRRDVGVDSSSGIETPGNI